MYVCACFTFYIMLCSYDIVCTHVMVVVYVCMCVRVYLCVYVCYFMYLCMYVCDSYIRVCVVWYACM